MLIFRFKLVHVAPGRLGDRLTFCSFSSFPKSKSILLRINIIDQLLRMILQTAFPYMAARLILISPTAGAFQISSEGGCLTKSDNQTSSPCRPTVLPEASTEP
jgi:hypothetical protein